METRANYLLIGAFTVAGFLGLFGFLLWFASVELDRQFAYYDVVFESVSGLSASSDVRFAGIPVGQVVDVSLDTDQSGLVRVRIEVRADTPVRQSSIATIETLGVTGVSYLAITAGNQSDPLLIDASQDPIPDIPSDRSALQSLSEDAPQILEEILEATRRFSDLLGPETQDSVSMILRNLGETSGNLDSALEDFSQASETIALVAEDIAAFTSRLDSLSEQVTTTLANTDATMQQIRDLAIRAETTLDTGDSTLESAGRTFASSTAFIEGDLPRLTESVEQTIAALRGEVETVGEQAAAMLAELRQTGAIATERLRETEATVAAADAALSDLSSAAASVEAAARNVDTLVTGDGTELVADLRGLIANANDTVAAALTIAETDLPAIIADVRRATDTAARAVESVSADLSAAAGRADTISADVAEALDTVANTFENANDTLAKLNAALETGSGALTAAENAFRSADRVLNDDVGRVAADLRSLVARLDETITAVIEDVPAITGELRQTAERANAAFAEIEATAGAVAPPLRGFAREGLPEYQRLARETRDLVSNLADLVRQIERDPARYFFGPDQPAFQR